MVVRRTRLIRAAQTSPDRVAIGQTPGGLADKNPPRFEKPQFLSRQGTFATISRYLPNCIKTLEFCSACASIKVFVRATLKKLGLLKG